MNSPAIAHLFQKQTKPSNCRGEKKTQQLPCDLEDFGAQIAPQFVGKITLNRSKSFPRKDSQPFDPPKKTGLKIPFRLVRIPLLTSPPPIWGDGTTRWGKVA